MKFDCGKITNFKQLYLIFTLCNILLFVYIAVCAIVDSFHLWPWGGFDVYLGDYCLIDTFRDFIKNKLFYKSK